MRNKLLLRIYFSSTGLITLAVTICCLLLQWPAAVILFVLMACLVFCFPFILTLHFLFFLAARVRASKLFFWMMLMASIPLSSLLPADLFVNLLPGKTWFLVLMGMFSAYVALVRHGYSISQLFNSSNESN